MWLPSLPMWNRDLARPSKKQFSTCPRWANFGETDWLSEFRTLRSLPCWSAVSALPSVSQPGSLKFADVGHVLNYSSEGRPQSRKTKFIAESLSLKSPRLWRQTRTFFGGFQAKAKVSLLFLRILALLRSIVIRPVRWGFSLFSSSLPSSRES